jgi:hypothetical protein
VLGYAVYGILSILLVYPIRYDEGNRWISTFSKWFYLLLIPLIVVLALAVWQRVDQYGITESRYVLIALSLWLAGITIYFLTDRQQNIRVIPMSLCIVALLAVIGPQSASSLSARSQVNRLIDYFESRGAWVNNKFVPITTSEPTGEGAAMVRFLVDRYGKEPFREILSVNIDSLLVGADSLSRYGKKYERTEIIREYLGLNYDDGDYNQYEYFSAETIQEPFEINGYDYLLTFKTYNSDRDVATVVNNTTITIKRDSFSIAFNLQSVLDTLVREKSENRNNFLVRPERLSVTSADGNSRLILHNLYFRRENNQFIIQNCEGYLLMKAQ